MFLITCLHQMDVLCLRERDLLNRFAVEVSQYQKQGESKEYSFVLVRVYLCSLKLPSCLCLSHIVSFWFPGQSYQLAEDLGRAFSDRAILQTFLEAEATVPAGSLKVIFFFLIFPRRYFSGLDLQGSQFLVFPQVKDTDT